MIVTDSHAHVISRDRHRYPLTPLGGTAPEWLEARGMDTDDLQRRMDAAGVGRAVLVQYGAAHGYDNRYVLDSAMCHSQRFVAVCGLDSRADDVAYQFTHSVALGAAGVRIRAPDRGSTLDWLKSETVWRCAAELGVPLAVHLMPHHHVAGIALIGEHLRRFPGVRVVLDHVGNPPWRAEAADLGLGGLVPLSERRNVVVKFSTVNLNRLEASDVDAGAALSRLVTLFGADRLMWGSDAPNSPGDYTHMLQRMSAAIQELSSADQASILGRTAARVYPNLEGGPD